MITVHLHNHLNISISILLQSPFTTKTSLYDTDPLKPHFYIVKLGLWGYTLFFLFLLKNTDYGYSLEPPRWGGSNAKAVLTSTHNLCFEQKYENYQRFLSENFQFLEVKFSIYLNRHVFVMYDCAASLAELILYCLNMPQRHFFSGMVHVNAYYAG